MSSSPGRVTKGPSKRRQCSTCSCSWQAHVPDPARYPLQRCLTGVSLLNPRGSCACTQYVEATVTRARRAKVGALR